MSTLPIPDNAIGFPGMVAMLQRTSDGAHDGKLVALRNPSGFVGTLLGATKPVFAWQVLVLGNPISIRGKPTREIIVADLCLRPVTQISPAMVELLTKRQAHQDFDAGMDDLKRVLNANAMDAREFNTFFEKAEKQIGIERALEVVPIAQALGELGFRQQNPPHGDVLMWAGIHGGAELEIIAGTNWFAQWQLTARCNTLRQSMWDETILPPEAPRGAIALAVVDFWRAAFGRDAQTPDAFDLGLRYEHHKANMRALDLDLPHVDLDGEMLRATRKWMAKRHGLADGNAGPLPDAPLSLTIDNGLMRMEAGGAVYGCSVRGGWIDPCQVSLREFLALPAWALKGHILRLTTAIHEVRFGSWAIRSLPTGAA
ncbi:MAG: hypothetical protein KIT86_03390 [Hydrogenophaga sp.]|uniref:hypothetical protein n=1 Tax=Hydrogenophaga sp. TaxID=1904254 RepID=UPI002606BCF4|nr:hypothetical protein [Hydrogenophaga sp.]MCW5668679.1 hypothetical protein [Hydrogenophaga sp.]